MKNHKHVRNPSFSVDLRKADTVQMIKTLNGLLAQIKNPEASKQFDEPPTEWMEATDKDLEDDDDV